MFFRDSENGAVDPKLIRCQGARPPLRQWWSVLVSPMEPGSHRSPLNRWSNLQILRAGWYPKCCWNHHLCWSTLIWRWKAAASWHPPCLLVESPFELVRLRLWYLNVPSEIQLHSDQVLNPVSAGSWLNHFPNTVVLMCFFCVKLCQTISRYPISDIELSTIASESSSVAYYIYIQSYSDWYYINTIHLVIDI